MPTVASNLSEHLISALATTNAQNMRVGQALTGWLYLATVDRSYLLNGPAPAWKGKPLEKGPPTLEACGSVLDTLRATFSDPRPEAVYDRLNRLAYRADPVIRGDSFLTGNGPLSNQVQRRMHGVPLRVVVIGAGCAGMATACALKQAFGADVSVLVVENRVATEHIKRPYSREWVTNIPLQVSGMYTPELIDVAGSLIGTRGMNGLSLNVLETMYLLCCKAIGVEFLFTARSETEYLAWAQPHLVVDGTGGRLDESHRSVVAPRPWPEMPGEMSLIPGLADALEDFGVPRTLSGGSVTLELDGCERERRPHLDGEALQVAMLKIKGLPERIVGPLTSAVREDNEDGKYFVWPAPLIDGLGEGLLLVNLRAEEEHLLAESGLGTNTVEDLSPLIALDRRWESIIAHCSHPGVTVEPPFRVAPRHRIRHLVEAYQGFPLLRVGDAVYQGHPKVGNGLGEHLVDVGRVVSGLAGLRGRLR